MKIMPYLNGLSNADASCRRPPKYERYKRNKHIKIEQMGNGHIRTYAVLEGFNQNGYLHHNQRISFWNLVKSIFESVSKAGKSKLNFNWYFQ